MILARDDRDLPLLDADRLLLRARACARHGPCTSSTSRRSQFLTLRRVLRGRARGDLHARARPGAAAPHASRTPTTSSARTTASSAKYFVARRRASSCSAHCTWSSKNLPWTAEWLARAGYAGHLVRDLSNTHVMIVGGGTLIATGLTWYVLPRIVGRPLASDGLAQCAFWFTAVGLARLLRRRSSANGIAIGRLVQHGWDYETRRRTWASGTRRRSGSAPA